MHHLRDAAGVHTDGRLVSESGSVRGQTRPAGPVSGGLVGSDGPVSERPGQPAGLVSPLAGSAPSAERLADEEADQAAHDEHDGQEPKISAG
jgi:hypothetical protein